MSIKVTICSVCNAVLPEDRECVLVFGIEPPNKTAICRDCEKVVAKHIGKIQDELCYMLKKWKDFDARGGQ